MKIMFISHSMVVDLYQEKLAFMAAQGHNDVLLITPNRWREAGQIIAIPPNANGFYKTTSTFRFLGFHGATFLYGPEIISHIKNFKPDIIHVEEEYYSIALFEILLLKAIIRPKCKSIFFTWQNIYKRYPLPFYLIEQYVLRHVDGAIAGNSEAAAILRKKNFTKPIRIIPQIGVDHKLFTTKRKRNSTNSKFIIGFAGRLERVKGLETLLNAVAGLTIGYELWIIGNGTYLDKLKSMAVRLNICDRLKIISGICHREIPAYLEKLNVLILPSRTTPNWKEQFGRVLIEAMACGVPVIGSNSGAIPEVISDAGLVFDENSFEQLRKYIMKIYEDKNLSLNLAQKGRDRVLQNYSTTVIAQKTLSFYNELK